MKKRALCLVLGLLMILATLLTGCASGNGNVDTEGATEALTITLYCIKQEGTTDEGIAKVQNALNEITENRFNTHLILKFYTEDEYYSVIDEKAAAIEQMLKEKEEEEKRIKEEQQSLKKAGITIPQTEASTEETTITVETVIGSDGKVKIAYPKEEDNQLDIFLINDMGKLKEYTSEEVIQNLSEQLSGSYKILNKYINSSLLGAVTIDGGIMAVPNNHTVGEYTYLLVNKELATDKLYYGEQDFGSFAGLETYLKDVATYYPDYTPLYNLPDDMIVSITGEKSLLGGYANSDTTATSRMLPKNLLSLAGYTNYLKACYNYKAAGYVEEGDAYSIPEDKKLAAAYVKGDYSVREKYKDDYYVYVANKPIATQQDALAGAFCISSYTKSVDRCMEIVSLLTTDAEVRNMLQYGVEGVNYTLDEDTGAVIPTGNQEFAYNMNMYHTGNQFILKPSADMSDTMKSLSANNWENAKLQNNDIIFSPYLFFTLKYITADNLPVDEEGNPISYTFMYTDEMVKGVEEVSKDAFEKIKNFKEYVDENGETVTFAKFLKLLREEVDSSTYFEAATDTRKNEDSIYKQYLTWYANAYGQDS